MFVLSDGLDLNGGFFCNIARAKGKKNPQERRPQEYVWLLVLDSNWLVDRVQPVSNPGLRVTHSWGTSFLLGGLSGALPPSKMYSKEGITE